MLPLEWATSMHGMCMRGSARPVAVINLPIVWAGELTRAHSSGEATLFLIGMEQPPAGSLLKCESEIF